MPELTYLQAISDGLREEMRADESVFCLGEDIGAFGGAFKITDGFIYPLNPDPVARVGQVNSMRNTHYLLVDAAEKFEGLPTAQFDNLVEMANGHLRRLAAAVAEYESTEPKIPVTLTALRGSAAPTRTLPVDSGESPA